MSWHQSSSRFSLILYWMLFAGFIGYFLGWKAGGEESALAGKLRTHAMKTSGTVKSATNGDALNSPSVSYTFEAKGVKQYGYSHVQNSAVTKLGPAQAWR